MTCRWSAYPAISIMPQLGSGKLKVLAVSTGVRSPLLPDIPTLKEAGIDVEADAWSGLIAPAGMPNPLTERIGRFVGQAVGQPPSVTNSRRSI